ncbi:MAG: hypothetical protein AVDCRST_MAG93-7657 [uncultured Chloroflexia bacterium]|uniref:Uncharacterized protein n=1 Tax=uncultured Chloroflexia bacterium TaxID=1672391 RepID=A0A6J4ML22_9CHLR|nr:MAG: hypothetical protein AVDCRST_MAG93-7657 [uncultured Chloroflexia bacterium]
MGRKRTFASSPGLRYEATMSKSPAIERAFTLARSGQCRSVAEIIRGLPEGDRAAVGEHLGAPSTRRDLILVCSDAWLAAQ